MGTNCIPLVVDLFLSCYERYFMLSLSDDNQSEVIEAFSSTSRYLDDLLNIHNNFFDSMVSLIYPLTISKLKNTKGNNFAKLKMEEWLLFSAYHLILLYICSKISLAVQSFRTDTIFILIIPPEEKFCKTGGVMLLSLGILADEVLYLVQVS